MTASGLREGQAVTVTFPSGRQVPARIEAFVYAQRAYCCVWHKRRPGEIADYPLRWLSPR
jgi:hypothetical protein